MTVRGLSDRNHIQIFGDIAIIDLYDIHSQAWDDCAEASRPTPGN